MTTSYRSLTVLSVAVFALLAYNFLGAAWTPAPATPPNNNTAAPVDVSGVTQTKTGNIVANIFAATSQMRSNLYCDALGGNCFAPSAVLGGGSNASSSLVVQNGYTWVDGLLVQWGKACPGLSPTGVVYNYPTVFPNAALQIVGVKDTPHNGATMSNFSLELRNRNSFVASNGGSAGCTNWIAVGY
ncbi:MAG: hypothetical protein RLZZ360_561 [Candidatus Parcubacteria bacterium]|jgi:hypothetical protein